MPAHMVRVWKISPLQCLRRTKKGTKKKNSFSYASGFLLDRESSYAPFRFDVSSWCNIFTINDFFYETTINYATLICRDSERRLEAPRVIRGLDLWFAFFLLSYFAAFPGPKQLLLLIISQGDGKFWQGQKRKFS